MTHLEEDLASQATVLGDELGRSRLAAHRKLQCTLLDDRCCAYVWGLLRQSEPKLVKDVELVYGDDFWVRISPTLRTVLGVMTAYAEHSTDELAGAAARGFILAEAALADNKAELIVRGREAGSNRRSS